MFILSFSYIWFVLVLSIVLSWCKIPNLIFSTLWKASKSTFWNKSKFIQHLYLSTRHLSTGLWCVCMYVCVCVCIYMYIIMCVCVCVCVSLSDVFVSVRLSLSLYVSVQIYAYLYFHLIFPCTFFLLCISFCLSVCVSIRLSVLPTTQANQVQSSLTNSGVLYIRNYVLLSTTLQANVS